MFTIKSNYILAMLVLILTTSCNQFQSKDSSSAAPYEVLSFESGNLKASEFVDTGANFSLNQADTLFNFETLSGVIEVSTNSNLDNIHSHYMDGRQFSNYTYSGSMKVSQSNSGVGVTFLSDYPNSDSYYRLSRDGVNTSFRLSARNSTACQSADSGITPVAGEWYSFKVLLKVESTKTIIQAKVWPAFAREPFDVQILCEDASANRRSLGTVGLWASGSGEKKWADLYIGFNPFLPSNNEPSQDCGSVAHGQSESQMRYQTQTVPFGSTCVSQVQVRTCNDGVLSAYNPNNYQFNSCTVDSAPPTTDAVVTISAVNSSTDDGNSARNVIDNDLNTRWSAQGDGETLDLVFNGQYDLSKVEIAFYKGNERDAIFDVDLLVNGSYVRVISSQTSTKDLNPVSYTINNNQAVSALRVIGHGNTENNWNSITEVKIYGKYLGDSPAPAPTPTPAACGSIAHGQSENRTRYQALSVAFGLTCQSQVQVRTCNNGMLSVFSPNNYQFDSCTVAANPNPTPNPIPTPGTSPAPTPTVSVRSASELNQALANATGGEVIGLQPGNYGTITVNKKFAQKVIILSTSVTQPALIDRVELSNANNITFRSIKIQYKVTGYTPAFGIFNSSNIALISSELLGNADNNYTNDPARAIQVQGSANITVYGNSIHDFGNGFHTSSSTDINYSENKVFKIMSDGMQFSSVQRVLIENNEIFESHATASAHPDCIQFFDLSSKASTDVTIRGNFLHEGSGDSMQAIFIADASTGYERFLIEKNIIYNSIPHGITFSKGNNSQVRNNTVLTVPGKLYKSAIFVTGDNNTVANNITTAIDVTGAKNVNSNNIIADYKNSASQYYYDKIYKGGFDGDNVSILSFMPVSGGAGDFGSNLGAEARIKELLGF